MDGKGYISNPYLSVSSVLSNYHKILIRDSVKKEFENKYDSLRDEMYGKLRDEIYAKLRNDLVKDLTDDLHKKLKSDLENLRRDDWERIGSPDIK
jgi:hypothetical protein